tara:strand:+ start:232 stop:618 length:387 start_codon:yes stop_codon:yes gene_type:complete
VKTIIFAAVGVIMLLMQVAYGEVEWRQKPVQCGPMDDLIRLIDEAGEEALVGGLSKVRIDEQEAIMPVVVFKHPEDNTFTIVEFHMDHRESCIIAWGGGADFDVYKFFDKYKLEKMSKTGNNANLALD